MNETIHIGHVIQPISIGHDIGNLVAHNIVMWFETITGEGWHISAVYDLSLNVFISKF